jgi:hypothetical protein
MFDLPRRSIPTGGRDFGLVWSDGTGISAVALLIKGVSCCYPALFNGCGTSPASPQNLDT